MARFPVEVKPEHIREGIESSREHCPVGLAMKEQLGFRRVWVEPEHVTYTASPFSNFIADLPDEAKRFIERFDDGAEVEPFRFEVDLQ